MKRQPHVESENPIMRCHRTHRRHLSIWLVVLLVVGLWTTALAAEPLGDSTPPQSAPGPSDVPVSAPIPDPGRPIAPEGSSPSIVSPDPQVALAERTPGFGGIFIDADGRPAMYVVGGRNPLSSAVVSFLLDNGLDPGRLRTIEGRYDYLDLTRWFDLATPLVLGHEGGVFVDLDEVNNTIGVGLTDRGAESAVRAALVEAGVPSAAVSVEITEPMESFADVDDRIRPVVGGLGIFSLGLGGQGCTLGFNVSLTELPARRGEGRVRDHRPSFVTNSHCTRQPGVNSGTLMAQGRNSQLDVRIGVEIDDPAYFTGGNCPSGWECRFSDAARFLYHTDVASAPAGIIRAIFDDPDRGSTEVAGTLRITGEQEDSIAGMVVSKIGPATGLTTGKIIRTCENRGDRRVRRAYFCQTDVEAGAFFGDSGAPVFSSGERPGEVILHGILGGGRAQDGVYFYSPMGKIEQELGALTTSTPNPKDGGTRPDLVPVPLPDVAGPTAFCDRTPQGELRITIRNQSNNDVVTETATRVIFARDNIAVVRTPPIPAGSSVTVTTPIEFPGGDVGFVIAIDSDLQVDERGSRELDEHETNNVVDGACIG